MEKLWAKQALLPNGWTNDVSIEITDGRITGIETGVAGSGEGILLPAPVNAHSHAFQRAMAGMTEARGADPRDTFWTWRQLMFKFLDQLTPQDVEAITAFVQMEMLEAGYGASVEFHYLHHQGGGSTYDRLGEMSERVAAAAGTSGMGLTLLPVAYQFGGCDGRALGAGQIRFGNDLDRFAILCEQARSSLAALPDDAGFGVAPHSLRAVGRDALGEIAALSGGGPVHMHLAEQVAEVEEVQAHWRARPVEWVLGQVDLGPNWCLIHCTQMEPHETTQLAKSGAIAGLCPITESSLGDGIFDGVRWLEAGGRIAIGSDSNIRISLSEELRTLDYSQRLRDRSRAALATVEKSTGRRMFDAVVEGGALAAGRQTGRIEVGQWADLMMLDGTAIDLEGRTGDAVLDTYIFAGDDKMVCDVWSAGRHLVVEGVHVARREIEVAYRKTMARLRDVL